MGKLKASEVKSSRTESTGRLRELCAARLSRLLIVEDCVEVVEALLPHLRRANLEIHVARDGVEALCAVRNAEPDVVLLDLGLPRMHGFKLLHRLREERLDVPVVVLTGDSAPQTLARARHFRVSGLLLKPAPARKIVAAIEDALEG